MNTDILTKTLACRDQTEIMQVDKAKAAGGREDWVMSAFGTKQTSRS